MIFGNTAARGGGIYLVGEGSTVSALNAVVSGNSADISDSDPGSTGRGGGVYVTDGADFNFPLSEGITARCSPPTAEGGLAREPPCNRIRDNSAEERGGGLYVANAGLASLSNAYIEGNSAGSFDSGSAMIAANDTDFAGTDRATINLVNSLVSDHEQGFRVIYAGSRGNINIEWSTLADNNYPAGGALMRSFAPDGFASRINLIGSVVWPDPHAGGTMLTRGGAGQTQVYVDCVIGFDSEAALPGGGGAFYSQIDPEFADVNEQNYRPGLTSPAIDYCSDFPGPPSFDMDMVSRGLPHTLGPTTPAPDPEPGGTFDLGAWAGQRADELFSDRFEQP